MVFVIILLALDQSPHLSQPEIRQEGMMLPRLVCARTEHLNV
jgi:hypothetical protein